MEGSVSSSASQPPGESPWKIAAKTNNIAHKQPTKVAYSITLAFPGKVAFCVPKINDDSQYLQRLQALIKGQQGVINQQFNSEAGSVVITYKTGMMSDFEMRSELASLLQTADNAYVYEQGSKGAGEQGSRGAEEQGSRGAGEEDTTQNSALSEKLRAERSAVLGKAQVEQLRRVPPVDQTSVTQHSALSTQHSALSTQHSKLAYTIVHAIPGRIRFHIPQIACDRQYVQRLENLLKADPVVTSERINKDAASVVITYKTGTLRDSQGRTHNVVEAVITHLTSLIQSANEATAGITAKPVSSI